MLEATAQPAPAQGTPSAPPGHGAAATRHSGCGGAHRLDAGRAGTERTGADVDVSGIWTLDAAMAPAPNNTVLRALDGKGRLMLPLEVAAAARVPAERDGTVLTVFLPGAAERPRSNFAGRH